MTQGVDCLPKEVTTLGELPHRLAIGLPEFLCQRLGRNEAAGLGTQPRKVGSELVGGPFMLCTGNPCDPCGCRRLGLYLVSGFIFRLLYVGLF